MHTKGTKDVCLKSPPQGQGNVLRLYIHTKKQLMVFKNDTGFFSKPVMQSSHLSQVKSHALHIVEEGSGKRLAG